jgi:hypothetical protein
MKAWSTSSREQIVMLRLALQQGEVILGSPRVRALSTGDQKYSGFEEQFL